MSYLSSWRETLDRPISKCTWSNLRCSKYSPPVQLAFWLFFSFLEWIFERKSLINAITSSCSTFSVFYFTACLRLTCQKVDRYSCLKIFIKNNVTWWIIVWKISYITTPFSPSNSSSRNIEFINISIRFKQKVGSCIKNSYKFPTLVAVDLNHLKARIHIREEMRHIIQNRMIGPILRHGG